MKTVEFKTADGRTRYYLAGEDGLPVEPVIKFLKFRDAAGYARNTLKGECIHLMHYFEFLEERGTLYEDVTAETSNKHVGTVIAFYEH